MDWLDPQKINIKIRWKTLSQFGNSLQPCGCERARGFNSHENISLSDILKIYHVWIFPMQILSLAFNQIDEIENLHALRNLN